MKFFKKFFQTTEVIEVEKPVLATTTEQKAQLANLLHHPGFKYLLGSFQMEKAKLETLLKQQRHDTIRDVDALQLGIFWLGYAERKCRQAAGEVHDARRKASDQEIADFTSAHSAIELVG